ncbi:amidohydrolase [Roseovarius spongiae]|uniref:Amidohydrolase n=2 Tax=Roseovarius spongiae TaxID=2320272 RepID=A0A3A8B598_9RHOB|nr:amidohydrolase [Roseovarius spongiae]
MQAWRRDFHRHPELGFDLPRTARRVAELLEGFGLEVHQGVGGSGVVGVLQRGNGPRAIGLRADMDALPIEEATGLAHASKTPGRMHACGHDGHMAMLLGAAKHLADEGRFDGRAVFIFQPNEEHGEGAAAMLADGLFARFPVDAIYGAHNMPGLPVGAFQTRPGVMTASEALFEIAITGQGGHAALPHMGVDALTVGAEIALALQTIVARKIDPARHAVVSLTTFETDGRRNVLPGRAVLRGDCRALDPETNASIEAAMRRIVDGVAAAHGVRAEVSYETIFPATMNDAESAARAVRAAARVSGDVDDAGPPKLFSEDFAHFAHAAPGCFMLIGNGAEGAHARPLHSPDYDFNDAALTPGSAWWAALVEQELAPRTAERNGHVS